MLPLLYCWGCRGTGMQFNGREAGSDVSTFAQAYRPQAGILAAIHQLLGAASESSCTLTPSTPLRYRSLGNVKQPRYVEPCCAALRPAMSSSSSTVTAHALTLCMLRSCFRVTIMLSLYDSCHGSQHIVAQQHVWPDQQ
jgi:hypothetical protein